ncbi:MAG: aspartate/glutamate racemase family protein [Kiloniellales bacterium]|nr:aspartate/glutamate racemase family protein [Kiloniellales bacterium]
MTRVETHPFVLGVVMLDTRFPRLEGEIGNPASFPFQTLYRRVAAATVARVVTDEALEPALAEDILAACRALADEGVSLIATSCGFLGSLQAQLEQELAVPVLSSALVLIPFLRTLHGPAAKIGVLTFDSRRLAPRHFAGWHDANIAVEGIETGEELYPAIAEDRAEIDHGRAEAEAVAAARRLMARHPDVAVILLECTNLSPYRQAIARATGRPVADLVQAICWRAGMEPS